ncbi:21665_t:CDS:2 [Entrophospora sp. SA101]|nr:21665_t:CDS:2 [Entrophospora sp. SA101]
MLLNDPDGVDEDIVKQEAKHFQKVLNSFALYKSNALSANNRRRIDYINLPEQHKLLVPGFLDRLNEIDKSISINNQLLKKILADGNLFVNEENNNDSQNLSTKAEKEDGEEGVEESNLPITEYDMDRVRSTIKQFVREWASERDAAYKPIIEALLEFYKDVPIEERKNIQVLVPGAGLGRLAFDIVNQDQLVPVYIPDVMPSSIPPESDFSMVAGDFTEVYGDNQHIGRLKIHYTAKNIIEYIELFHRILKPGGLWINIGPLLYHYENTPGEMSIELSLEEVKMVVKKTGFQFQRENIFQSTYTINPNGMLKYLYDCAFWTCVKQ